MKRKQSSRDLYLDALRWFQLKRFPDKCESTEFAFVIKQVVQAIGASNDKGVLAADGDVSDSDM